MAASNSVPAFSSVLEKSNRILALCGAGLSASSGLSTFRGAGGLWRNHESQALATPGAFRRNPGLVWAFYAWRRHMALKAHPNKGHEALAKLARIKEVTDGFWCLSQNVDGISQRAGHPRSSLKLLHGTLFDITCFNESCDYVERDNFSDPLHPSLAVDVDLTLDPNAPIVPPEELPHCPKCQIGLLRPGVVWFGESLPTDTLQEVDAWLDHGKVDLMLVIGTTAQVWPAAGYVLEARKRGARIAVVNLDGADLGAASGLTDQDFVFGGDAAELLPEMLKAVIGDLTSDRV